MGCSASYLLGLFEIANGFAVRFHLLRELFLVFLSLLEEKNKLTYQPKRCSKNGLKYREILI